MPSIDTLILCPGAAPMLERAGEGAEELLTLLGFDLAIISEVDGSLPAAVRAFVERCRRAGQEGLLLPRFVFRVRALDQGFPVNAVFGPEDCLVLAATPAGLAAAQRLPASRPLILRGRLEGPDAPWLAPAAAFLRRHGQALLVLDYGQGGRVDLGSWPQALEPALWGQVLAVAGDEVRYHAGEALARDSSLMALGQTGGLRLTVGRELLLEDPLAGTRLLFASLADLLAHRQGQHWCGA